jgi:hypothetical protein
MPLMGMAAPTQRRGRAAAVEGVAAAGRSVTTTVWLGVRDGSDRPQLGLELISVGGLSQPEIGGGAVFLGQQQQGSPEAGGILAAIGSQGSIHPLPQAPRGVSGQQG